MDNKVKTTANSKQADGHCPYCGMLVPGATITKGTSGETHVFHCPICKKEFAVCFVADDEPVIYYN